MINWGSKSPKESPILTRLSGPQEPPSDQRTLRPNPKSNKRKGQKAKMETNRRSHSTLSMVDWMHLSWGHPKPRKCSQQQERNSDCPPRKESRETIRLQWLHGIYHYAFLMKMARVRDPESFFETAKDPWWVEAMNEEMQALFKNETCDLVPSSPHQKAIGYQWIYKVKHHADDTVNWYKAQLWQKAICTNTRGRLWRDLCPRAKDDDHSERDCACNIQGVATPPDGHQERLSSRRIRWGGVHDTTSPLQVEHSPPSGMSTQKASLWPQAGT